ncbi:8813_t:CDS:2 [Ambispora leptoticha]|uniref:8813_t:CDS:1 n=1 Tax=Ambispora leptoticha TaxID=144679 RepID=A0A9N9F7F4_9GLOM|nr:8813_t:CDS:2 [Ambispora leptoticha]
MAKISVKINEETPILLSLPLNAKLSDIRIMLSKEPEIRMNNKMSFLSQSNKITKDEEAELLLSEILINNSLKVIGEIEPEEMAIAKMCAHEYGLHFTKKGPFIAKKRMFNIMQFILEILPHPITIEEILECKTKEENICAKNYIATSNITDKFSFPSISERLQLHSTDEIYNEDNIYSKFKRIKAILTIKESDMKLTKDLENAIDEALASHNQRESLRKVTEDFGQFYCKKFELGGVILSTEKNETSGNNSNELNKTSSNPKASVFIGKIEKNTEINYSEEGYSFFNIQGGLEETYNEEGIAGWINSLNDYRNWKVAEYSEIHSIFDILDEERKLTVTKTLGKYNIHSLVSELNPILDLSERKPFVYEYPKHINISDTDQVFLTVMTDDKPRKDFVARLHYIDENSQPIILVQQLGKLKNKAKLKRFSFKLGCTVVSKSLSSLFEQDSEKLTLESSETQLITTKNRCSAVIKNKARDPNTGLIATCVTRSKNIQSDPRDSEFIMGSYFNIKNSAIEACMFCYDKQMNLYNQFDSLPYKLSLNNCIISEQQNLLFGQAQIIEKNFTRFLFSSKKSKITFDDYPRIISTSYTNDESARGFQKPIFLNLITTNCEEEGVHGFFNITRKYAMFRSLNNPITKNQQVAYFCAPLPSEFE